MKRKLNFFPALLVLFFCMNVSSQDILIVEPGVGTLNAAIKANGGNKIYQLRAESWYQLDEIIEIVDYHLQIIGEVPSGGKMPATLQTNIDAGGAVFSKMFDIKGDFTLKNVYVVNADLGGVVAQECINQSKDNGRIIIQNCILDPISKGNGIKVTSASTKTYFTDNLVVRQGHRTGLWDGFVFDHWNGNGDIGYDTIYVENNTFVCIGSGIHNSNFNHNKHGYEKFNHNTIALVKCMIDWGVWEEEFYWTNNLMFDVATRLVPRSWNTSLPAMDAAAPNVGLIFADTIPGETLPSERVQYIQYNMLYRNPGFTTLLNDLNTKGAADGKSPLYLLPWVWPVDSSGVSRETAIFNDKVSFPNFQLGNNLENIDPQWEDELIYKMSDSLVSWMNYATQTGDMGYPSDQYPPASKWANWHWDLDGDPSYNQAWPVFNGKYKNPQLLSASIEGLPLGDLNWFPEKKAIWEANKIAVDIHMHSGSTEKLSLGTGIADKQKASTFSIYPNPVNDNIRISKQADEIHIYEISGRKIKSVTNTSSISVSDFPEGMYLLQIKTGNEISTEKFIIKK